MSLPQEYMPTQNNIFLQSRVVSNARATAAKYATPYMIIIAILGLGIGCYFFIFTGVDEEMKEEP